MKKGRYRSSFYVEIELLNILNKSGILSFDEICRQLAYSKGLLTRALRSLSGKRFILLAVYRGGRTKDFVIVDPVEQIRFLEALLKDNGLMQAYYSDYLKKLNALSKAKPAELKRKINELPKTYEQFIRLQRKRYEELKKYGLYKNKKIFAASITERGKQFLEFLDKRIREIIKNYHEPLVFLKEIQKLKEEAYEQFDRLPQYTCAVEGGKGSGIYDASRAGEASAQQDDKGKDE